MNIIVAMDKNRVIGKDNKLPWNYSEDLKYFKKMTEGKVVIMGRKTYESIGRELPDRHNIILSKTLTDKKLNIAKNLEEAIKMALKEDKEIFIIGGENIYKQTIPLVKKIYITRVEKSYEGDSFFPELSKDRWQLRFSSTGKDPDLIFQIYSRKEFNLKDDNE